MVYCDKSMIYLSSIDTTNILKVADYIFSLMDKIVEEVGEENYKTRKRLNFFEK